MKVVVIGLGSMGRRRIRLMQAMPGAPEIVGVNRSAERRAQVEKEFGIRTFRLGSLDVLPRCDDVGFVRFKFLTQRIHPHLTTFLVCLGELHRPDCRSNKVGRLWF